MKTISRRHTVLLVLLIATLLAAYFAPSGTTTDQEDDAVAAVAERSHMPSTIAQLRADESLPLDRLTRRHPTGTKMDPFHATIWFVAPPATPPTAAVAPPAPTAPPLPFQYNGKQEDADGGKNVVVYLSRGTDSFAVTPGEKFDRDYQLEKIDKGALVIVYLPLATKQRLSTGTVE